MHYATHDQLTADDYEHIRSGNHLITRRLMRIREVLQTYRPKTILDYGCGTGGILAQIAAEARNVQCYGYDPERQFIEYANKRFSRSNLTFHHEASNVPQVDVVFSIDVLHHVHPYDSAITFIQQVLHPGGHWIVIEPNSKNLYVNMIQRRPNETNFRTKEFLTKVRQYGFTPLSTSTMHLWPSAFPRVPGWMGAVERLGERTPFVGGSVVIDVRR